jgi:hypothetical protein
MDSTSRDYGKGFGPFRNAGQKSDPRFRGSPPLSATGLIDLASMSEIA